MTSRTQIALQRHPRQRHPMSAAKRRALQSHSLVSRTAWKTIHSLGRFFRHTAADSASRHTRHRSDLDVDSPLPEDHYDRTQFRIRSVISSRASLLYRVLCCSCEKDRHLDADEQSLININSLISAYLSFSHRTSYFLLFAAFSSVYYGSILAFALVYWAFSLYYPECVTSAGSVIGQGDNSDLFADAFVLSWTTFSTVGYGSIYPSTGANNIEEALPRKCMIVGIIGSFEAFVGVLYAGFCTAVLFGKVIRSQSQAQVYFSDPLVIRYGKEELNPDCDDDNHHHANTSSVGNEDKDLELGEMLASIEESQVIVQQEAQKKGDSNIPCPSLEFRLVNRLHDVMEGEIVEAQLDCVAILGDSQIDTTDTANFVGETVINGTNSFIAQSSNGQDEHHTTDNTQPTMPSSDTHGAIAISHSPPVKQTRSIMKLTLESNEHPFFRRVWFGRHRLDQHSPLLSQHARLKIQQNGGHWPPELNNHTAIRDNLHFRHILVCFSGTSNANATSVYAQKVYDLIDVNVGYRFVPMNYHAETGELKTDSYLLNAISEQKGGGAEPFL